MRAYIIVMRLCALLFVCWHVSKNWEGLETILLQPWCLRYICLKKKYLRDLAKTPQLVHVPFPMPWVQIILQCGESCKNKTSRKYKDWGPTTSHLVFDLFSGFATEHRESCLSCTSLVYWWSLLHERWLLQQQKQPHLGRWESTCSVHQSSPNEIQGKHLRWNSWRLSAGTCHHSRPFTWNSSRTRFHCSWRRYPLRYTEKCGSNMMALQRTSASSMSTSEHSVQGEGDLLRCQQDRPA